MPYSIKKGTGDKPYKMNHTAIVNKIMMEAVHQQLKLKQSHQLKLEYWFFMPKSDRDGTQEKENRLEE